MFIFDIFHALDRALGPMEVAPGESVGIVPKGSAWPPVELKGNQTAKAGQSSFTKMPGNPFGITSGECKYDTGCLWLFTGPEDIVGDNILVVLRHFPQWPNSGNFGKGELRRTVTGAVLLPGFVDWTIE
jgi:hypothetical protein